jgi:selenocysteine lyase/cysteine desulfurase
LNVPAIAGLGAGAAWLQEQGLDEICRHASELTARLIEGFRQIEGVTVFGPRDERSRVGVVSIAIEGCRPQEAAVMLDSAHRIQTRPGLHCAPGIHRALGTTEKGGTLRFSVGPFSTAEDIDQAVEAVAEIATLRIDVGL